MSSARLILAASLFAVACSPASETPSSTADSAPGSDTAPRVVNVYSARHYRSDAFIYELFTEQTGIEVNLVTASGDQLIERVRVDGERSPADVIITVDAARLHRAEQAGLFAQTDYASFLPPIADNLVDPDGYWVSMSLRTRVIARSTDRVAEDAVTSYADLADPRWQGRVCTRGAGSPYNQSLLAAQIAENGEDAAQAWAAGIVANFAHDPVGGDRDQLRSVAADECDLAITNHYYYLMLANSDNPADQAVAAATTLVFPDQAGMGAHVNVSGIGIAANAPHPDEARELVSFFFSEPAQRAFAELTNEITVVEGVEWDNANLANLLPFEMDDRNVSELGDHNETAQRIFDRVGWQ